MIGAILSLIPTVLKLVEGLTGKTQSDKTAEQIKQEQLSMPYEETEAERVAKSLTGSDMPGYKTSKDYINQLIPKTAEAFKETASSPVALIDLMSRGLAETDKQYQELTDKNVAYHQSTLENYQNVLQRKAGMNLGVQEGNIITNKEAITQKATGTKDLLQSVEGAAGAGINTYAMMKKLGYEKDLMGYMGKYFGSEPAKSSAVPSFNQAKNIFADSVPAINSLGIDGGPTELPTSSLDEYLKMLTGGDSKSVFGNMDFFNKL